MACTAGSCVTGLVTLMLLSLRVLLLRLQGADTSDRTGAVVMLRPITAEGTAAAASSLFSRLAELAHDYAPAGATVTKTDLMRDLSGWPLADPRSHTPAPLVTGRPAAYASGTRRAPGLDT